MQCSATRMGSSFTLLFACLFAAPCIGPESAAMAGPAAGYPVPAIARHWRRPVVHRVSLLDGTEELAHPVSQLKVIRWTAALHRPRSQDTARLHLWLGDYELSAKGRPTLAIWHFRQAQRLSRPSSPVYGAAAYDSAVALYSEGAYRDAMAGFDRLLTHPMPGYDWKDCALWYRHAAACVGYHAERAAMGIPEPRKLDPLAGAAALSTCLRSLGLPWSKSVVMAACPEAGESLEFSDMQQAAKKLGADLRPVMANDQGLMALPKPAVAMVERDHWVSVIRADRRGVAYLCSDCGPYPGGEVDLSWSQWHALNPAYYLCVTRMRSKDQRWISRVLNHRHSPVRIASRGSLSGLLAIGHALQLLKGAVIEHACSYPPAPGTRCAPSLECVKCLQPCPGDSPGSPPRPGPQHGPHLGPNHSGNGKSGPSGVDPVNLASGEEEYGPAVDLDVYNPTGPSVEWSRIYNSLRNNYSTYGFSNDFGGGWSTGYNVGVYDPTGGGTGNKYLVEPFGVIGA